MISQTSEHQLDLDKKYVQDYIQNNLEFYPSGQKVEQYLDSGVILCILFNKLNKNPYERIIYTDNPDTFKKLENLNLFIARLETLQVHCFEPMDLIKKQNLNQVFASLRTILETLEQKKSQPNQIQKTIPTNTHHLKCTETKIPYLNDKNTQTGTNKEEEIKMANGLLSSVQDLTKSNVNYNSKTPENKEEQTMKNKLLNSIETLTNPNLKKENEEDPISKIEKKIEIEKEKLLIIAQYHKSLQLKINNILDPKNQSETRKLLTEIAVLTKSIKEYS